MSEVNLLRQKTSLSLQECSFGDKVIKEGVCPVEAIQRCGLPR